jgi:methyl-accepting chemotaxis protein
MDTMARTAEQATVGLENLIRNDFAQIGRDFASATALLKTIGTDQQQLASLIASVNSALSTSVTSLNSSISSSTDKVSNSANELTSNFESVAKELQAITRSIELSVMHLKNDLDELKTRISR